MTSRQLAVLVTYACALFGVLYALPNQPEHELGLVYVAHYARDFFLASEARWAPAWPITALPPLLYQGAGLLARALGVERAYAVVVLFVALAVVAAGARLSRALTGADAGSATALAVNPALYFFLFINGQAPFLLGVAGASLACAWLIASRDSLEQAAATALAAAALCTHPLAGVCLLPMLLVRSPAPGARLRQLAAIAVAAAVALFILWPMRPWLGPSQASPMLKDKLLFLASFFACVWLGKWGERRAALGVFAVLLVGTAWVLGHFQFSGDTRHRQALSDITAVVSASSNAQAEYLVVGLGHERATLNRSFLGRSLELTPPWWHVEPAPDTLPAMFSGTDARQVHWLVSASDAANQLAPTAGFSPRVASTGGVMLWERNNAEAADAPPPLRLPLSWALGPLLLLMLSAALLVANAVRARAVRPRRAPARRTATAPAARPNR
jgi:hypothetical protein